MRVETYLKRGSVRISRIHDEMAELREVYSVSAISEGEILDLSHLNDERIRSDVENLVVNYNSEKVNDVNIKMHITVKDDIGMVS